MQKSARFLFVVAVSVVVFTATPKSIFAATTPVKKSTVIVASPSPSPTLSPSPSPSPSPISTTTTPSQPAVDPYTQQIEDLKQSYRNELAQYREDEKAFIIAHDQYTQLQTLNSLEEAVRTTHQVMLTRLLVLKTYLQLLDTTLLDTKGVDLPLKAAELTKLQKVLMLIDTHQTHVQLANDRASIAQVVTEFTPLYSQVQSVSYETLSLISYGRIRAVNDKLQDIKNEMQQTEQAQEKDAIRLAQKMRGFDQIQMNIDSANAQLDVTSANIQRNESVSQNSVGTLSQATRDLGTAYASISRALSFLNEILNT